MEKVLFPFPLAVVPSLNVTVQSPEAVTFPVMVALFPLQIVALALVMAAVGRVFTFTVTVAQEVDTQPVDIFLVRA
jgi:hypothetical protein